MTIPDRRVNDLGGLPGGPVDRHEHANTLFEKRVDAMVMLLVHPATGAFKVDGLRRAVESNSAEDYVSRGYYEKWLYAIRDLVVEQSIVTQAELDARMREITASTESVA